jgi:predicted Rossmann fold flavoprotein
MEQPADVAIVGGGAGGLAAAVFAARRHPDRSVVILEATQRPGAKILLSGGGRCNITHAAVTPADYRGGSPNVIRRVLNAFSVEQTIEFFKAIGVTLHEEEGGKLFPDSNRAATVLEALLDENRRLGVRILTHHRATRIESQGGHFRVMTSAGALTSRTLLLATGGLSVPVTGSDGSGYALASSLGHSLTPTTPALVPLVLDGDFHTPLSGITHDVELTVRTQGAKPVRLAGSLLWTHFGISGPAALDASRFWHRSRLENQQVTLSVNLLPGDDFEAADKRLISLASAQPRTLLRNALSTLLPSRLVEAVLKAEHIDGQVTMAELTRDNRRKLVHALIDRPLPIRDSRGYQHAEVTAGGVPLNEVDPATLESRKCPRLFLAGEILDVDGRLGGFNFQWAWSSAWGAAAGIERCLA